jgi:hypothetical protein
MADIQFAATIGTKGRDKWRPALLNNIREQGLVNPLILLNHRNPKNYKERWLKTGNNRFWCLQVLGWTHVPVIITGSCDHPCIKVTLEEAQTYCKDGHIVYIAEHHGDVLKMADHCKPEDRQYP